MPRETEKHAPSPAFGRKVERAVHPWGAAGPSVGPSGPFRLAAAAPPHASRWRPSRRTVGRTIATLALVVAATTALIAAGRSPLLGLTRVQVRGLHVLHRAVVLRAAGVHAGEPVLDVQLGSVAANVSRLPWVAHVWVTRLYPAGLRIQIQERRAVAWIPVAKGGTGKGWLVAPGGTVLAQASTPPALPVLITSGPSSLLSAGAHLSSVPERSALGVLGITSAAWSHEITVVRPSSGRGLEFGLRMGTTVVYGTPAAALQKQAAVTAMLTAASAQGRLASVIDVRAPAAPTLRLGA